MCANKSCLLHAAVGINSNDTIVDLFQTARINPSEPSTCPNTDDGLGRTNQHVYIATLLLYQYNPAQSTRPDEDRVGGLLGFIK